MVYASITTLGCSITPVLVTMLASDFTAASENQKPKLWTKVELFEVTLEEFHFQFLLKADHKR